MKIRTYKAIIPAHVVIYGAVCVLFLVGGILAARAPDDGLPPGVPELVARGLPWLGLVLATGITGMLVLANVRYGRQIAWYTGQGVAVLPGEAQQWIDARRSKLEENIQRAWLWWSRRHPDHEERIEDRLNGCHLAVIVQDGPLKDPRLKYPAKGMAEPGKIRLWFPRTAAGVEAYLKGFEGREFEDLFFAYLRHEVAHVCLYAMGSTEGGEAHHKQMHAEGCPDA